MQRDTPSTSPVSATEGWTVARLQRGDQAAWRAAFRDLWPCALQVVSRRIFDRSTAQDIAQETLMILHREINKVADERHMRIMTAIVAQRRTSHYLRDQTAGKRDRRQETVLEAAGDVAAAATQAQAVMDLEAALAKLEPLDRQLLEGHFITGLKSHELADRHGLNASTVRGRMKRALDRLKSEFGVQLAPLAAPA